MQLRPHEHHAGSRTNCWQCLEHREDLTEARYLEILVSSSLLLQLYPGLHAMLVMPEEEDVNHAHRASAGLTLQD